MAEKQPAKPANNTTVPARPRRSNEEVKERLRGAVRAEHDAFAKNEPRDRALAFGEFLPVEGFPRWYVRPLKARQQLHVIELMQAGKTGASQTTLERTKDTITLAALVTFRVNATIEEIREAALAGGNLAPLFAAVSEDDLLDTFTLEQIEELLLDPVGLGATKATDRPND